MKFNLYSGDEIVGWTELPFADPPMGVVYGPLHPNKNYEKIQPIIRELHLYDGSMGNHDKLKWNEVRQKIKMLNLEVRAGSGEALESVEGIHLLDFSEELPEESLEITVLGLKREQFLRFWPDADEQYRKQFQSQD